MKCCSGRPVYNGLIKHFWKSVSSHPIAPFKLLLLKAFPTQIINLYCD